MHLTLLEHGIYRQLIDMYYLTESPIPSDLEITFRKICARTQEEKEVTKVILKEFFEITDFGWVHSRCDLEIGKYSDWDERNTNREESERSRQKRHRDERKVMFCDLRNKGIHPRWNLGVSELRELHNKHCNSLNSNEEQTCNAPATEPEQTCNAPATEPEQTCNAPATEPEQTCNAPATAITTNHKPSTQEPSTVKTHTDYCSLQHGENDNNSQILSDDPRLTDHEPQRSKPTPAASVCISIKKQGISDVNPAHPELLMLIDAGATVDEFVYAARTAKDKGKGFAYIIGIVKKQRENVKAMSGKLHEGRLPNKQESLEQRNFAVAENWVPPEMRVKA
jgi:uncharacterized protein YdaU (DUF1376 family)